MATGTAIVAAAFAAPFVTGCFFGIFLFVVIALLGRSDARKFFKDIK